MKDGHRKAQVEYTYLDVVNMPDQFLCVPLTVYTQEGDGCR